MKSRIAILIGACVLCVSAFGQTGEKLPVFEGGILKSGTAPVNGTNEIDTITIGGTPTAGTFTMTFDGRTTGAITWSATNATLWANIDTALELLPNIGSGGVTVGDASMTAGIGTCIVTFVGANVAKKNVPALSVTSSLTGTSPTLAVATTTPGVEADGRISPKGSLCIALDTGIVYGNTGTPPNPTWAKVSAQ